MTCSTLQKSLDSFKPTKAGSPGGIKAFLQRNALFEIGRGPRWVLKLRVATAQEIQNCTAIGCFAEQLLRWASPQEFRLIPNRAHQRSKTAEKISEPKAVARRSQRTGICRYVSFSILNPQIFPCRQPGTQ
jgi:hypothetical protein